MQDSVERWAGALALAFWLAIAAADALAKPQVEEKTVSTAFVELRVRSYEGLVDEAQFGGGIAALGNRYLLAARTGELYLVGWDAATDALSFQSLPHRVPLNLDEFKKAVEADVNHVWFRVADVAVQEVGDRLRLFVSHHRWNSEAGCYTTQVSSLEGRRDELLGDGEVAPWQRVFVSHPCLEIQRGNRGHPFQGNHIGGRLALRDERTLLLSIGDYGFDGWNSEPVLPQDLSNSYGKTLQLDLESGASEIVSWGHRNPQGLHVAEDGAVWLTEHGPKGGDELNLIRKGANYGWPFVTYGTTSRDGPWPLSVRPGSHEPYAEPFYSWTPSIAVSNLIQARGAAFAPWQNDLLVASLSDMSVWRVRVRDGRVVYTERIRFGHRIRDIEQGGDGRIVLWSDFGALISVEPLAKP